MYINYFQITKITNNKTFLTTYGYMVIMHLVYPPPIPPPAPMLNHILSNFSQVLQSSQEKSKTMVTPNVGGKQGALLSMWKLWMQFCFSSHCVKIETKTAVMRLRKKRNACEFVTKQSRLEQMAIYVNQHVNVRKLVKRLTNRLVW